ncbi:DNA topoisomerase [Lactiplantibacillus plantarum]|nr:DNA topoisomerase [Lactiplantibacillus plantarum]MCG0619404.1 DNA topoisomerase [Lactiplantibacillus plantarum]MCG0780048.1 DNA topoisomerase [Lactiplantibacillus plantarum]MCG0807854.1 DNA topoisomerase [Lactiplantibacillus plantarum]MCG0832907.1 DNA topoisomerase [Lactiplantibacillus plantarum]
MVYQRDQAIKNFKPEPYFELNAEIVANQQKFVAKLAPYQRFKDKAGLMTFMQAKHVQKGSQAGLIKGVKTRIKNVLVPNYSRYPVCKVP